jgi:hypothetical protein
VKEEDEDIKEVKEKRDRSSPIKQEQADIPRGDGQSRPEFENLTSKSNAPSTLDREVNIEDEVDNYTIQNLD